MKICSRCNTLKELPQFNKAKNTVSKLTSHCKLCLREARLLRKQPGYIVPPKKKRINKGKRHNRLMKTFGWSLDLYNTILEGQNNVCGICKGLETSKIAGKVIALAIDHCHDSGVIRGLLCKKCNIDLGYFRDNPKFLIAAAEYLTVTEIK